MRTRSPVDDATEHEPRTHCRSTLRRRALAVVGVLAPLAAAALGSSWWLGERAMNVHHTPGLLEPSATQESALADVAGSMVRLEAGTFQMGTPADDPERDDDETWHAVTIARPFLLSRVEVTQDQYEAVMADQPLADVAGGSLLGADLPAADVTWLEAVRFCNRLSEFEDREAAYTIEGDHVTWDGDAPGYRLPTEAEWEFAARAGEWHRYGSVDDPADLCSQGNVADSSARPGLLHVMTAPCDDGFEGPAPVGSGPANAWGLHDLVGNVWEWTWDGYGPLETDAVVDPRGADDAAERITRGGSWWDEPFCLRTAARASQPPHARRKDLGFRLARSLP